MPNGQPTPQQASLDQLIRAIEDAIRSRDPALQSQLVHRSAEHLVQRWSRMAVDQKPAFDNLLLTLMQQVDDPGRSAFAGRLADLRRGPPRTTRLLARSGRERGRTDPAALP